MISVLVWDSPRYTRNLLDNLAGVTPGRNFHIRILDQGSGPETRDMIRAFLKGRPFASAEFLPANIGYGGGHNRVFDGLWRQGPFDYFVTVNNDLVFGEPGWLNTLVEAMEADPECGLGGPFCSRLEPKPDWPVEAFQIVPANAAQRRIGDFLFVTGAVAIMRVAAIRRLGLFDEVYAPAYWEDADLAARFAAYGWSQRFIDIQVAHGYLGHAERVNTAKLEELKARFGDFAIRNRDIYFDRWRGGRPVPHEADLRSAFPRLYMPGPPPA